MASNTITEPQLVVPEWPVPDWIRAVSTTRIGGVSNAPFDTFNLGIRVGGDDAVSDAIRNRRLLTEHLALPVDPCWLWQTHSTDVVDASTTEPETKADASFSRTAGTVCAVMSADCLPVLFADREGKGVAAAHAGWRGLLGGVLEATIASLAIEPDQLLAWLGPAIGPSAFEVGAEVRDAFLDVEQRLKPCFSPAGPAGKWMADLPGIARWRLQNAGIESIYASNQCTYSDASRFYSYRRDGVQTGRMASLIWIADH